MLFNSKRSITAILLIKYLIDTISFWGNTIIKFLLKDILYNFSPQTAWGFKADTIWYNLIQADTKLIREIKIF